MAFRQMLKRMMVDDKPVVLPEVVSAGEIMRSIGKDPLRYDLVLTNPDETTDLYPHDAIIRVRNHAVFETQLSSRNGR